jgi:hypothetical protein
MALTTPQLREDFYIYVFIVNGLRTLDPNNPQVVRDGSRYANYVITPEAGLTFIKSMMCLTEHLQKYGTTHLHLI